MTPRPEPYVPAGPRDPRCRHGLRPIITVAEVDVSHSQRVCRAASISDTRDLSYVFSLEETEGRDERWTIKRDDRWSGVVWSVPTALGPVYVQCQSRQILSLGAVVDAVNAQQAIRARVSVPTHAVA